MITFDVIFECRGYQLIVSNDYERKYKGSSFARIIYYHQNNFIDKHVTATAGPYKLHVINIYGRVFV